jgi:hypothetical protein
VSLANGERSEGERDIDSHQIMLARLPSRKHEPMRNLRVSILV